MKIIDAHIHFSNIDSFKEAAAFSKTDYSKQGLLKEMLDCNISTSIGMGVTETVKGGFPDEHSKNPMLLDLDRNDERLKTVIGVNPHKLDESIERIEERLQEGAIGIKIYAGYYHFHVHDEVYNPVYELAKKYKVPVVIHSGDTYSERGLLKYSHPLEIDELALKYRDINFIIAHFGDPWIMETAELVRKNTNVYADLSGLIVGDEQEVKRFMNEPLFMNHIKRGLVYADSYKKVIFGTDWPLVQMKPYIEFVKVLIPKEYHEDVFYNNAYKLFKFDN